MTQQSMMQRYEAAAAEAQRTHREEMARVKRGLAEDVRVALRQLIEKGLGADFF